MKSWYKTFLWLRIGFMGFFLTMPVQAVSQIKTGQPAPAFDLPVIGSPSERVTFSALKGKPTILMFGELYNENQTFARPCCCKAT